MSGERDLNVLLRSMSPKLDPVPYVFCCVSFNVAFDWAYCLGAFKEAEGMTLILAAEHLPKMSPTEITVGPFARITLEVHSSLHAVGLIAAVSQALSQADISTNPISAYHHDHLFVPWEVRERALDVLLALSEHAKLSDIF
ncbi:MAG: ACT domain-containing protein [Deinococcaceae bacterium]